MNGRYWEQFKSVVMLAHSHVILQTLQSHVLLLAAQCHFNYSKEKWHLEISHVLASYSPAGILADNA
jgi:hypothetical protein